MLTFSFNAGTFPVSDLQRYVVQYNKHSTVSSFSYSCARIKHYLVISVHFAMSDMPLHAEKLVSPPLTGITQAVVGVEAFLTDTHTSATRGVGHTLVTGGAVLSHHHSFKETQVHQRQLRTIVTPVDGCKITGHVTAGNKPCSVSFPCH